LVVINNSRPPVSTATGTVATLLPSPVVVKPVPARIALRIAQPLMAGLIPRRDHPKSRLGRKSRSAVPHRDFSIGLTLLPSHQWLGYFQKPGPGRRAPGLESKTLPIFGPHPPPSFAPSRRFAAFPGFIRLLLPE